MKRKTLIRLILVVLALPVLAVLITILVMQFRHPLPARAVAQPLPGNEKAWWLDQPPLTSNEVAAQQWFADITYRLPPERNDDFWDVGGSQHGNFAIRYQAAFSGYAAAAFGMRTPAYAGLTRRIISNTVMRIADRKAWSYVKSYWSDESWFPDPCACGNVMYTGHLMMLMALHEALSGDPSFNRAGVDLVWDENNRFNYTTKRLADVTAKQIRAGDGGITCEPGLVFFACNNHPHVTFRLLEGMDYGDWRAESEKWEKWALAGLRATAGGGAFRLVQHEKSGLSLPRGLPGFDGWCLLWYSPWASDPENLHHLWELSLRNIDWSLFEGEPNEAPESVEMQDCCNPIKIPASAQGSFLAAAARACGDGQTAGKLENWLDKHFLKVSGQRQWMTTNPEWQIGVSANRAIALAQAEGSDLRAMIRRPLPREYFNGLLLDRVIPDDTPVYQAIRNANGDLLLELDGRGREIRLFLRNLQSRPEITASPDVGWNWKSEENTLILDACERVTLKISESES
ncbi:MAG: hypothetical protein R6V06_04750 [Kiritimatiellia bacterium]